MLLRTIYARGAMIGRDLGQYLCLPFKVIREPLRFLKDEKLHPGGRRRPRRRGELPVQPHRPRPQPRRKTAMEQCAYVGPAPVPLEDYVEQCYRQTVTGLQCYPEVAEGAVRAPGAEGGDVQRHRPGDHQRAVGVHLRPAGQRQDGDGPGHRRLHEHRRRVASTSRTRSSPTATSSPSSTRRCTPSTTPRPSTATTPTRPSAGCSATGAVDQRWVRIRRPGDRDRRRTEPAKCSTCGTTPRRTSTRRRSTSRRTAACS